MKKSKLFLKTLIFLLISLILSACTPRDNNQIENNILIDNAEQDMNGNIWVTASNVEEDDSNQPCVFLKSKDGQYLGSNNILTTLENASSFSFTNTSQSINYEYLAATNLIGQTVTIQMDYINNNNHTFNDEFQLYIKEIVDFTINWDLVGLYTSYNENESRFMYYPLSLNETFNSNIEMIYAKYDENQTFIGTMNYQYIIYFNEVDSKFYLKKLTVIQNNDQYQFAYTNITDITFEYAVVTNSQFTYYDNDTLVYSAAIDYLEERNLTWNVYANGGITIENLQDYTISAEECDYIRIALRLPETDTKLMTPINANHFLCVRIAK